MSEWQPVPDGDYLQDIWKTRIQGGIVNFGIDMEGAPYSYSGGGVLPEGFAVCRLTDKQYSHRNGETEPPTEPGRYWVRFILARTQEKYLTVWSRDSNAWEALEPPVFIILSVHGPIPEPRETPDDLEN